MNVNGNDITVTIGADVQKATNQINKFTNAVKGLSSESGRVKNLISKFKGKIKLKIDSSDADKATKKMAGLQKVFSSFTRIAFYRAVRSAIKFVTDGFKEGLENAYQFSKGVGGPLASALDNLSSAGFRMKNQLGAAFGQLLVAVSPILLKLIDIVTAAANAITQLFAAISGQSTYQKATNYWKEWGDAASAAGGQAKSALRYLAPFDELNVLPSASSSGGGGGSGLDYNKMFETAEIDSWWKEKGEFLASLSLENILFKWDNLTEEDIAAKFVAGAAVLGGVIGWTVGGIGGALIGMTIGVGLTLVLMDVDWNQLKADIEYGAKKTWNDIVDMFAKLLGFNLDALKFDLGPIKLTADEAKLVLSPHVAKSAKKQVEAFFAKSGLRVNLDMNPKLRSDDFEAQVIAAVANANKADLPPLNVIADVTGIDVKKLVQARKNEIPTIAAFSKTNPSGLTAAQKTISTTAAFSKTDQAALTPAQKTINTTASFSRTDLSGLTAAQKTIPTTAVIDNISVTAKKPTITVDGKLDKIRTSGGAFLEVKKNGGVFANGRWNPITAYAGGGRPVGGEMFIAREAGPELVGRIGQHTAVMNNDQIVASVSDGVASANEIVVGALFSVAAQIVGAIRENGASDGSTDIDTLAKAVTRLQNNHARAAGI